MAILDRPNKWLVYPILFLNFLNTGLIAPVIPDVLVPFFDNDAGQASFVGGLFSSGGSLLSFIVSPFIGQLSDRYGRKPFILLVVAINSLQIFALAAYPGITLWFYLIAKALGKISVNATVLAYLADCTTAQERTASFGYASATIYLALAAGPTLNLLSKETSFMFAVLGSLINIVSIAILLPETQPHQSRLPSPRLFPEDQESGPCETRERLLHASTINPPTSYGSTSSTATSASTSIAIAPSSTVVPLARARSSSSSSLPIHPVGDGRMEKKAKPHPMTALKYAWKNKLVGLIVSLVFFTQLCEAGIIELEHTYMRQQLHLETSARSYAMVFVGLNTFLVMTFIFPFLSEHMSTTMVIMISLACKVAHAISYACVATASGVYGISVLAAFGFMAVPAASSHMSRRTAPQEQGVGQGALSGWKSLAQCFGPLISTTLYRVFADPNGILWFPGMPFIMAAVFALIAIFITWGLADTNFIHPLQLMHLIRKPFLPRWHPLYGENTGDGPPQFVPLPSQKELSEYLKMFKRLDRDCNGQLDVYEVRYLAKLLHTPTPAEIDTIVRKFDKDGDQNITFEEFVTRVTSLPGEDERLTLDDRMWTHLQQEFNKVDSNNDGYISREEAVVLAQEAYIPSNAAVMSLMVELDANHDGHVTLDEFSRAMKKLDFIGFHMIRHAGMGSGTGLTGTPTNTSMTSGSHSSNSDSKSSSVVVTTRTNLTSPSV